MKDNLQTRRKYVQIIYPTKDLHLEYIKNSKPNNKKTHNAKEK